MNFAKNFKWQLVVAALGFSLVLTARVNSQEIVNTEFSAPSTSVSSFDSATPGADNTSAAVTPQSVYTPVNALVTRANNDMQQLNAPSMPRQAGLFAAIAILLLCCVSYAVAKKVSDNRQNDRRSNWNSSPIRAKMLPSHNPQPINS